MSKIRPRIIATWKLPDNIINTFLSYGMTENDILLFFAFFVPPIIR